MKISHSKMKTSGRCWKAYEYRYVRKIRKRVKSKALYVGTLVHSCLESYFKTGSYMQEIISWRKNEYEKMFKEEQSLNSDIIPMVKALMRGYVKHWSGIPYEVEWAEKEFEVEIANLAGEPIILTGKMDVMWKEGKRRWLGEHKTCASMPGEEVRLFDSQAITYGAVLPLIGEKPADGVVWDYIRKKLPQKPHELKRGGLSTAKIDTLPEVYLAEIKKRGLDPKAYADILESLENKRDSFFRQIKLPLKKNMMKEVIKDSVSKAAQMIYMEEAGLFPRNLSKDCNWCDYRALCMAELMGDDPHYVLKCDYVEKKDEEKEIELDIE